MSGSPLRRVARAAAAPVRSYLNEHFEMVKDEVRRVGAIEPSSAPVAVDVDLSASWVGVVEMQNAIAELSLYQGRVLGRMTDEISELGERIGELERLVRKLSEIVGASVSVSDDG